jgi:rhodanese-related sulfurtransferase
MLNNFKQFIRNLFIVLSVLSCISFFTCKDQTDSRIKNISVEEMQSLLKTENIQLVDVRTPKEYHSGFIKNAKNIDYFSTNFDSQITKLDKEKPVILYCKSGNRSTKSAEKFLEAGFLNIYNLEGGITQWRYKGLNVIKQ